MDAESVPAQSRKGKGKGKRSNAKPKSKPAATDEVQIGDCDLFCQETGVVLLPKQRGCESCYRDLETMRRDAKAAGAKAQKWMKQAEKKEIKTCSMNVGTTGHQLWDREPGSRVPASFRRLSLKKSWSTRQEGGMNR